MKKIYMLLVILVMFTLIGCEESSTAEKRQTTQTQVLMDEMDKQVGMPNITNFFEKKMAKKIFELRDRSDLVTYAYAKNMDGSFTYLGRCMGYGLPYSVQYTNPMRRDWSSGNGVVGYLPQVDPNGLYMPSGLSATWLMMVDEDTGETYPYYSEDQLTVSQRKMRVNLLDPRSVPDNY